MDRYHHFKIDSLLDETLVEAPRRGAVAADEKGGYRLIEKMVDAGLRAFTLGMSPEKPTLLQRCLEKKHAHFLPPDTRFGYLLRLDFWDEAYAAFSHFSPDQLGEIDLHLCMIRHEKRAKRFERSVESLRILGARSLQASVRADFTDSLENSYGALYAQIYRCIDLDIRCIRIVDWQGALYPEHTQALCRDLVADFPELDFCLQTNNARGLGLANALLSVYAGFNVLRVTLSGMGNEGDTPALELIERIAGEKSLRFGNARLDSDKLAEASHYFDERFRVSHEDAASGELSYLLGRDEASWSHRSF